jgi:AraC-like DNA-binding protein
LGVFASRPPIPPLRPFVRVVWVTAGTPGTTPRREHVLPTGGVHVVLRSAPLRVYDGTGDRVGRLVGDALVGGARTSFYIRDAAPVAWSVGALLEPGAAPLLLGVPAHELADAHTRLDDLWGDAAVASARACIGEQSSAELRLAAFERLLRTRLPTVRGVHPAIAAALARLRDGDSVAAAVEASGYSHRGLVALFRDGVGLSPKLWSRLQRFQRAIARAAAHPHDALVDVAYAAGYSDQSHFTRELRELAGMSPRAYVAVASAATPNHVPIVVGTDATDAPV